MGRAGTAVRLRARRGRIAWVRKEARLLVAMLTAYVVMALVVYMIQPPASRPYFGGGLSEEHGFFWLLSQDGFDRVRLGAEAKRWTSSTLRKARRAGWKVVDSIPFEGFDVDHVLVGPGGIYAIETKFTSASWHVTEGRLVSPFGDPIWQARYGARKIKLLLGSRGKDVVVSAVVLAWGKGARTLPRSCVEGVIVLPGRGIRTWMAEMSVAEVSLTHAEVREVIGTLDDFLAEREEYERSISVKAARDVFYT
jgi:hypothetical protein